MQFRLLGPLEVLEADVPVGITARRERALLLRLLMDRGRPVASERLIDDLWDDRPPVDARGALRVLVARIRRTLAAGGREPPVVTSGVGYELHLDVDDEVDAAQFEAALARGNDLLAAEDPARAAEVLADGLALWRGPALGDLADLSFARPEGVRLDELRLAALDLRIEADLSCGRHRELAGELEALCQTHPLRENLWAHRMVALYRSGRQADALRTFQELRSVLADEVGLDPTPALAELEAHILAGDLPDAPPRSPGGRRRNVAMPSSLATDSPRFVGRELELDLLESSLAAAREGAHQVVLLHGDTGIGKSRLAEEMARRAAEGGSTVVHGQFDPEGLLPYQAFVEALRGLGVRSLDDLVPGDGGDAELRRAQLLATIRDHIENAAQAGSLMLVLDDLQWADAPSLLLFKQLARSRTPSSLLMLATYQDAALPEDHPLVQIVSQLERRREVHDLELGPFSAAEVTALVAARLDLDDVAAEQIAGTVTVRTGGHPLFTEALVEALRDPDADPVSGPTLDSPTTVRQFVAAVVGRLSRPARTILAVGSACGTAFSLALARRAAGLDPDEGIAGVEECVRARLIYDDAADVDRIRFKHAIVRDVIYHGLASARRAQLHLALADAAADLDGSHATAGEVARHLACAPPDPANLRRLVHQARLAGDEAMAAVAFEAAATHYCSSLDAQAALGGSDPAERTDLLIRASRALALSGQPGAGGTRATEAIELGRTAGHPLLFAQAALALEECSWTGTGFAQTTVATGVETALRDALAHTAGSAPDPDMLTARTELLARLPRVLHWGTDPGDRLPMAREATALAEVSGSPRLQAVALEATRWALWGGDDVTALADVSTAMLTAAREAGDDPLQVRGMVWEYLSCLDQGDIAGARRSLASLRHTGTLVPDPLALWYPTMADAALALMSGHFAEAEELTMSSLTTARRLELAWAVESVGVQLHQLRREKGRLAEVEPAVVASAATHADDPVWQLGLADLHLQLGRPEDARDLLRPIAHSVATLPRDLTWLSTVALAADLTGELGDAELAEAILPALTPAASRVVILGPGLVCVGSAARTAGALATLLERWEQAEQHLDEALAVNQRLGATPWTARTHVARAQLWARRGRASAAQADLDTARGIASAIGSEQILGRIDLMQT